VTASRPARPPRDQVSAPLRHVNICGFGSFDSGTGVATLARVTTTQHSTGDGDMVEQAAESPRLDWRLWALGAALSTACAALVFLRRHRAAARDLDAYEEWWRRREQIRANGDHNTHLFV
jgi:hypothetical protein